MKTILQIVFLLLLSIEVHSQTTTINYTASAEDISNPERGFYVPSVTQSSNFEALSAADLLALRDAHDPWQATYTVNSTIVQRTYILDHFVAASLNADFLAAMQADFDNARLGGVKLILRYSYTNTPTDACGNWICPPYGDASKIWVLAHIAQLKPYLQANSDIIATMQMGFIGVWGENYYTDYFGDASLSPYILTTTNWEDRNDVIAALLDAVPANRTIQVRYPQQKQRFVYGTNAPLTSAPLTLTEAYTGTDKARLGFHNDCLFASADDFGTFYDYGPPVSQSDTATLKPYFANDSRFVPVGGETCSANNPYDNCSSLGGMADIEMRRFHYSYLNSDYNNADVNNDWDNVCLDNIKKELGYRFVLLNGIYSNSVNVGELLSVNLTIENEGYAAPYNPRGAEIILRNTNTDALFFAPLDADPRLWLSGMHTITQDLCLPPNIASGSYELLLHLPDPEPTLFDNPLYSIRLANDNVWEMASGYNKLNHTVTVNTAGNDMVCNGELMFTTISVYDPAYCPDLLDIDGSVVADVYVAGNQLLSNGQVQVAELVWYQSGNTIELNADFEVQLGAEFWAVIQGCYEGF